MFFDGQQVKNCVMLGAVSYQFPRLCKLSQHTVAGDLHFSLRRRDISRQTLESCRFARPIDAKQGKTFTIIQTKRYVLHGKEGPPTQLRVGLPEVKQSDYVNVRLFLCSIALVVMHSLFGA